MKSLLRFHRRISQDLGGIIHHYEINGGTKLADEFYAELMTRLEIVERNPNFFPYTHYSIRRANLNRFPYHFLYEIRPSFI
jgi:plasmid stabilization system protein ParE